MEADPGYLLEHISALRKIERWCGGSDLRLIHELF